MTRLLALDRAERIWGDRVSVTPAVASDHKPGSVEWWVDVNNRGSHQLDCNGHVLCHSECIELERLLS